MPESVLELAKRVADPRQPLEALAALVALRRRLEDLEEMHVENALRGGWSWSRIGDALAVSKQAVHKKHARRLQAESAARPAGSPPNRMLITAEARRSVAFARQEASALGHRSLGTEHLLLGAMRTGEAPAALALRSLGISLSELRNAVDELSTQRRRRREGASARMPPREIAVSVAARAAFEQALHEAVRVGSRHLGVEHILLAVLRQKGGAARRVLARLGVTPAAVEERLESLTSEAAAL